MERNKLDNLVEIYIEKLISGESEKFETGFKGIDRLIDSNMDGKIIILASRPGMSKASFAQDIGLNIYKKMKGAVYFFSGYESEINIAGNVLYKEANVFFRKKELSKEEILKIKSDKERIKNIPYYIFSSGLLTTNRIHWEVDISGEEKKALIIIDDLDQIASQDSGERTEKLHNILQELKMIAVENKCPILVLSNLLNSVEKCFDKHPRIEDLPNKDILLEHSDAITTLYRADVYEGNSDCPDMAEFTVLKNLGGDEGVARLSWNKELFRYENR